MQTITVKYNGSTVHITGLEMRSSDDFTMNACAALTRTGHRMATARTGDIETAEQALRTAKALAGSLRKKVCKSCEAAALAEQPTGQTYRFLVTRDLADEEGTEVTVTAGSRAEAKAKARQLPGVVAVAALN